MMDKIFYWVFNMSIVVAITGSMVFLIGKIKATPRKLARALWIIPLFRAIFPVGIGGKYSLLDFVSKITKTKVVILEAPFESLNMPNFFMGAAKYFPFEYKSDALERFFRISATVWIIVCAMIILIIIALYTSSGSIAKDAKRIKDNIYYSEHISSPVVYGIIRPKILLPPSVKESDIKYVVLHENAHIRYHDNLWRIVALTVASIHWFNPFVWLFVKSFFSEMEYVCDETAVRGMSNDEIKAYSYVLLECAQNKDPLASPFASSKLSLRIDRLFTYKRISAFSAVFFVVLLFFILYFLGTNAA